MTARNSRRNAAKITPDETAADETAADETAADETAADETAADELSRFSVAQLRKLRTLVDAELAGRPRAEEGY